MTGVRAYFRRPAAHALHASAQAVHAMLIGVLAALRLAVLHATKETFAICELARVPHMLVS